jgi:hypothetical protein
MKPLLIDMPIESPEQYDPKVIARLRTAATAGNAKRYVFDEQASLWIGKWAYDHLTEVLTNWQQITAPFDQTYFELNTKNFYRGVKLSGAEEIVSEDIAADELIGFFWDHGTLYNLAFAPFNRYGKRLFTPGLDVYSFTFNQRQDPHDLQNAYGPEIAKLTETYYGMKIIHMFAGLKISAIKSGGKIHQDSIEDIIVGMPIVREIAENTTVSKIGTIRNKSQFADYILATQGTCLIGMILLYILMNRSAKVIDIEIPTTRVMYASKPRAVPAHTKIIIHLEPHEKARLITTEPRDPLGYKRASPIPHEVSTHYAHFHTKKDCEHDWKHIGPEESKRFICLKCGGLKTLRKQYHKGGSGNSPAPIREVRQ